MTFEVQDAWRPGYSIHCPLLKIQKGGFRGPKVCFRVNQRHYFKDCYICGDVDFIFGGATALFETVRFSL